ncbi:hypothetical protein Ac2012v2_007916 [Leucoagaricus gongylophorus]
MTNSTKNMPYVRLGNSGLKVSKLILGCMSYGTPGWREWVLEEAESIKHIKAAYDAGINTFDTANVSMTPECRPSPYIRCHRFDPDTPIEETMHALNDVVKNGWVRYIGMSSCHAWQFSAMQNYAINNNLTPFISMQNHYNLIYREEEREMFPTLNWFNVASIPWSPIARGLLCRPLTGVSKRKETDPFQKGYTTDSPSTREIIKRVEEVAKVKGISMAQVSLAWTMSKPGVTAPIIGTTSLDNLYDLLGAVDVHLTVEEIQQLEEPYEAVKVFGH